eukprot:1919468-Amphidinium_carterae.1
MQHGESILQQEKILEIYISTWRTERTIDTHGTTSTRLEYAINDFLNIYLYNNPKEYAQAAQHLRQPHYLTVVHTTERLITERLSEPCKDLKSEQQRNSGGYTKKTLDVQFQIHSDRIQRQTDKAIKIGDYMEIRTTYKQKNTVAILDKQGYKQHHFHEYSVITTDIDMNEDYAKTMIVDIYQQAAKKQTTACNHRFIVFMIQYHAERRKDVMKRAGLTEQTIDKGYEYVDERTPNLFNGPNIRNLTGLPVLCEGQCEEQHNY